MLKFHHVINNEDFITYIYNFIVDLEVEPMDIQQESQEETLMEIDIDELCARIAALTI